MNAVTQSGTELAQFAPEHVNRLAKLKKADIASEAERLAEGTGWMPAVFETGHDTEPQEGAQGTANEADAPEEATEEEAARTCLVRGTVIGCPLRRQGFDDAPRRNGQGTWGYAPTCCGRLCESVPSSTLTVRCPHVTKDGSPTRRSALPWSFQTTPQPRCRKLWQGRSRSSLGC